MWDLTCDENKRGAREWWGSRGGELTIRSEEATRIVGAWFEPSETSSPPPFSQPSSFPLAFPMRVTQVHVGECVFCRRGEKILTEREREHGRWRDEGFRGIKRAVLGRRRRRWGDKTGIISNVNSAGNWEDRSEYVDSSWSSTLDKNYCRSEILVVQFLIDEFDWLTCVSNHQFPCLIIIIIFTKSNDTQK